MNAIGAVGELVAISLTVVVDAQPELFIFSLLDDLTLALRLNEDAALTEADATESFATTEEPCKAVA